MEADRPEEYQPEKHNPQVHLPKNVLEELFDATLKPTKFRTPRAYQDPNFTHYNSVSTDIPKVGFKKRYSQIGKPGDIVRFTRRPSPTEYFYFDI